MSGMTRDEAIPVLVAMEAAFRRTVAWQGDQWPANFSQSANALAVALAGLRELATVKAERDAPVEHSRPEVLAKAIKLVEALIEPHEQPEGDDHAWRTCRRCLAREELEYDSSVPLWLAIQEALKTAGLWKAVAASNRERAEQAEAERDAARRTLAAVETAARDLLDLYDRRGEVPVHPKAASARQVLAALTAPTPSATGEGR